MKAARACDLGPISLRNMLAQPLERRFFISEKSGGQRGIIKLDEYVADHALKGRVYQKSKSADVGFAITRRKIGTRLRRDGFQVFQVNQQRVFSATAEFIDDEAVLNGKTEYDVDIRLRSCAYNTFVHAVSGKTMQIVDFHW